MYLALSSSTGISKHRQICDQIRILIATGQLQPGTALPAIRTLAQQLGINPNTVARAYLDLEHAGLVEKRHGSGTYVAQLLPRLTKRECLKRIGEHVDTLLAEARLLGVSPADVIELIHERGHATP